LLAGGGRREELNNAEGRGKSLLNQRKDTKGAGQEGGVLPFKGGSHLLYFNPPLEKKKGGKSFSFYGEKHPFEDISEGGGERALS